MDNKERMLRKLALMIHGFFCLQNTIVSSEKINQMIYDMTATLNRKNKIIITGIGKNAAIAKKCSETAVSLGIDAMFLDTSNAMHGDIGFIKNGDYIIFLSKSAKTRETLDLIDYIGLKNVTFSKTKMLLLNFNRDHIKLFNDGSRTSSLCLGDIIEFDLTTI